MQDIKKIVESAMSESDRPLTSQEIERLNELQDELSGLIFFLKNEKALLHPDNIRNNNIVEYRLKKVEPLMKFLEEVSHLKYKLTSQEL